MTWSSDRFCVCVCVCVRDLLGRLFAFERGRCRSHRFLKVMRERKKSDWLSKRTVDSNKFKVLDARKFSRWFNYLVDNIYLQFTSDHVLRQSIGIPMGTNCAVFVANLFCFSYEFEFVSQLVTKGEHQLLRQFVYTKRFVDDLLAINNPSFGEFLYRTQTRRGLFGIYPDFLELVNEQDSNQKVSFLDTEIVNDGNCLFTRIFDKREHPPLANIEQRKYPHPSSFLSHSAMYGIVTSRLHCFSRICNRRTEFVHRSRIFLREFLARGYARAETAKFVARFLKSVPTYFHVKNIGRFVRTLMR